MTNIFKKSLVAIALASVSTGAMAATIDDGAATPVAVVNVASEWAANVPAGTTAAPTNTVTAEDFVVTLGTAYTPNDMLTFTFTGTGLDQRSTSVPTTLSIMDGANIAGTIGWISSSVNAAGDTEVVYRVTSVDTAHETNGGTITFSGVKFAPNKLGTGISVSFSAKTSDGTPIDTAGGAARTAQLIRVGSQFASISVGAPAGLGATIDVAKSRTQFTPVAAVTATFDIAPSSYLVGTTVTPFAPTATYGATAAAIDYTLTGNFGWMLKEDGTVDATVVGFTAPAGCAPLKVLATKIEATCTAATAFDPTFTIAGANKVAIPAQTFSLAASQAYTVGSVAGVAPLTRSAGTWALNGSDVQVSYMPYSSTITQVINVTNRSSQDGDISVVAIDEAGNSHDLGVVAQSKAGSIQQIAGAVKNALEAKVGAITSTQRFAFQIVTNAPEADVEVYTAYNTGGNGARLVVNSSNGGGLSK